MKANLPYFWYAAYTNPRAEKSVSLRLIKNNIEVYLPLVKKLKQWSDRKKWVEEPLFNSYIFVNVSEKEYTSVLATVGIVRFITFSGKAVAIPENQMSVLRRVVATNENVESTNHSFEPGDPVKIVGGPFLGLQAELVSVQNEEKVIIRIEAINQVLIVNVSKAFLEPLVLR